MVYKCADIITFGEIARYPKRLLPISRSTHIVVKIGREMVDVPVDNRQIKFIEKEHPVGSIVELEYDSGWRIRSHMAPLENDITVKAQDIY